MIKFVKRFEVTTGGLLNFTATQTPSLTDSLQHLFLKALFSPNTLKHQADVLRFKHSGGCFGKAQFWGEETQKIQIEQA